MGLQYWWMSEELERVFLQGHCSNRKFVNGFKLKRFKLDIIEKFSAVRVMKVAQRNCRCPMPGEIQGQMQQGSEQLDQVEAVPAHYRGLH